MKKTSTTPRRQNQKKSGETIQGEEISDILTESSIPVNNTKQALPFIVMMKNMIDFYMNNPHLQKSMDGQFQSMVDSQLSSQSQEGNGNLLGVEVKKNLGKIENCRSVPNFENKTFSENNDVIDFFKSTSGTLKAMGIKFPHNEIFGGNDENFEEEEHEDEEKEIISRRFSEDAKENNVKNMRKTSKKKKNQLDVVHNYSSHAPKLMFKKKDEPSESEEKVKGFSSLNKYNRKNNSSDSLGESNQSKKSEKSRRERSNLEKLELDTTQSLDLKPEPLPKSPNRITNIDLRISTEKKSMKNEKNRNIPKIINKDNKVLIDPDFENESVESDKKTYISNKIKSVKEKISDLKKKKEEQRIIVNENMVSRCLFKKGDFEGSFEETLVFENSNRDYKNNKEEVEEKETEEFFMEEEKKDEEVIQKTQEEDEKEEDEPENNLDIPISKPKITPKKQKLLNKISTKKKLKNKVMQSKEKPIVKKSLRSRSVNQLKNPPRIKKSNSRSFLKKGEGIGGGRYKISPISRSQTARQSLNRNISSKEKGVISSRVKSRRHRRGSMSFREDSRSSKSACRIKDYIKEYNFENNTVEVLREDILNMDEEKAKNIEDFGEDVVEEEEKNEIERENEIREKLDLGLKEGLEIYEKMKKDEEKREEKAEEEEEEGVRTEREDSLEGSIKSKKQQSLNLNFEKKSNDTEIQGGAKTHIPDISYDIDFKTNDEKIIKKMEEMDEEVKKFEEYIKAELKKFEDYKIQQEELIQKRREEQEEKLKKEEISHKKKLKSQKAKQKRLIKEERLKMIQETEEKVRIMQERDTKEIERARKQVQKKENIIRGKDKKIKSLEKEQEKTIELVKEKNSKIEELEKRLKKLEEEKTKEILLLKSEIKFLIKEKEERLNKVEIINLEQKVEKKKPLEVKLVNSLNKTEPIKLPEIITTPIQNHKIVEEDSKEEKTIDLESDCESLLSKKYQSLKRSIQGEEEQEEVKEIESQIKNNHFSLVKVIQQTEIDKREFETESYDTNPNIELITEEQEKNFESKSPTKKFKLNIDPGQYNYDANQYYQEYLKQNNLGFKVKGVKTTETGKEVKIYENGMKQVTLQNGAVKEVREFYFNPYFRFLRIYIVL